MRSIFHQQDGDNSFASKLLDVGNGSLPLDVNGLADISTIGNYVFISEVLCTTVYPNLSTNYVSHEWMCEKAILAPTNATIQTLNTFLLRQLPTQERCYTSVDSFTEPTQITFFSTNFLNSQDSSGLPPHKLSLKLGCPTIFLRNLNPPRLCDGTRKGTGESILIPGDTLTPTDCVFPMKRVQFPIRLSFAMTINKPIGSH
uniref:DNA helicase Pif1-like 2B domain-containing protein n=1 Tax=Octopus bimaculoides TaxID=37653 RepID=A0A0L8G0B8_OCTBM